jgi:hypothetical protein
LLQLAVKVTEAPATGDVLLADSEQAGGCAGCTHVTVTDAVLPVPPAFEAVTR